MYEDSHEVYEDSQPINDDSHEILAVLSGRAKVKIEVVDEAFPFGGSRGVTKVKKKSFAASKEVVMNLSSDFEDEVVITCVRLPPMKVVV